MFGELLAKTSGRAEALKEATIDSDEFSDVSNRDRYGEPGYWETRYEAKDTTFEWLLTWEDLEPMMVRAGQTHSPQSMIIVGRVVLVASTGKR